MQPAPEREGAVCPLGPKSQDTSSTGSGAPPVDCVVGKDCLRGDWSEEPQAAAPSAASQTDPPLTLPPPAPAKTESLGPTPAAPEGIEGKLDPKFTFPSPQPSKPPPESERLTCSSVHCPSSQRRASLTIEDPSTEDTEGGKQASSDTPSPSCCQSVSLQVDTDSLRIPSYEPLDKLTTVPTSKPGPESLPSTDDTAKFDNTAKFSNQQVIALGHYQFGNTIGTGTYGRVKLATHNITGHQVAVKILSKQKLALHKMDDKIKREINILKLLRHRHIIRLFEVTDTPNEVILVWPPTTVGHLPAAKRLPLVEWF